MRGELILWFVLSVVRYIWGVLCRRFVEGLGGRLYTNIYKIILETPFFWFLGVRLGLKCLERSGEGRYQGVSCQGCDIGVFLVNIMCLTCCCQG